MKKIGLFLCALSLLTFSLQGQETVVKTAGRKILVNGAPYFIKGICYHPVPKGKTKRDFTPLDQDLLLMQEAGINTIRVYEPIDDKEVLDKLHQAGIKLIVGFGFNQGGVYDI